MQIFIKIRYDFNLISVEEVLIALSENDSKPSEN